MSNPSRFAGLYRAVEFAYGAAGTDRPGGLSVSVAPTASGAGTITLAFGYITLADGTIVQRPKSIAFGNMKQSEFQQFFDATEKLLSEKMGVSIETLRAEISLPAYIRNAKATG